MQSDYQNILVPIDGSVQAELALKKAVTVAQQHHAHIDLLNVLRINHYGFYASGSMPGDVIHELTKDAVGYLQSLVETTGAATGFHDIAPHVRFGNPKTVIASEFIKDHHNDLIMLGATGMSAVARMVEGSVTAYVSRMAPVDVFVVRTDLDRQPVNMHQVTAENQEQPKL
ncbi:universal stress protein [Levilactobacillus zymae]|jgi:Universal stress protein UspA and related nucleotide-binding proteins|uniref:Universal stress protein UspA n=1 Tax=Levilactobacillus zymae TaxID=267363 RepID=A0A1Y6K1I4_9LACO|nr:universal stress protein [Levilactobacillus zymae]KRL11771.1 UspA family nucleotide-binding protein [Levilactobacillus zymae DSM 19395]QFR62193.1 universal stress protein [Levilactobacillus zymae]GEO72556.1 universal stress protein UspA [Levilactobacillus zymae]SMS15212.1 Universal stress protein family [Levilactobacillus zymae]